MRNSTDADRQLWSIHEQIAQNLETFNVLAFVPPASALEDIKSVPYVCESVSLSDGEHSQG